MKNLLKTIITSRLKMIMSILILVILLGGLALAVYLIQTQKTFDLQKKAKEIEMEKIVELIKTCGDYLCESPENTSNCPKDCTLKKLTCQSRDVKAWHTGSCNKGICEPGYLLTKCEQNKEQVREICQKEYGTQCLLTPSCQPGDTIVATNNCDKIAVESWEHFSLPILDDKHLQTYCNLPAAKREQYYQKKTDEAKALSDKLEDYIRAWYNGKKPAEIPAGFFPPSIDNEKTKSWRLISSR